MEKQKRRTIHNDNKINSIKVIDDSLDLDEGFQFHKSLPMKMNNRSQITKINKKRTRSPHNSTQSSQSKLRHTTQKLSLMLERISINKSSSRSIKIFSDMSSSSSISRNLFKNYHPCVIPSYYPSQIKTQILTTQINKIKDNFDSMRNLKLNSTRKLLNKKDEVELKEKLLVHNTFPVKKESKNFFNQMKTRAETNSQWFDTSETFANGIIIDNHYTDEDDDDEDYQYGDDEDSNDENNPNNSYPSGEEEDEEEGYPEEENDINSFVEELDHDN